MDLTSSGLRDRLGSLSKPDLSPTRKEEINCNKLDTVDLQGGQLISRCVIIQRDERGYGLTVSGDNPVFIQSVKEDGAAARAGVQKGDRIIKVNGTLVTQSNHVEVVKLIKSGSYVALTLLGPPLSTCPKSPGMEQRIIFATPIVPQQNNMTSAYHKPSSPTERVTAPVPVDSEKQQQLSDSKIHTIKMMLEQELSYVEKLRSEFARSGSEKTRIELVSATKRVKTLEEELSNLTVHRHDSGISMSPHSPPSVRNKSKDAQEKQEPPSLPPRRHPLPHQMSLPNVTVSHVSPDARTRLEATSETEGSESPCLNRTKLSEQQSFLLSNSLENIQRSNMPAATSFTTTITTTSATTPSTTSWINNYHHPTSKLPGGPTHSRQRSSPDALLYQTENLRQQHLANAWTCGPDLSRSQSEITGPRKFITSDSFSDGENHKKRKGKGKSKGSTSRASSFGTYDNTVGSPRITPPGTPPPPYGSPEAVDVGESRVESLSLEESPVSSACLNTQSTPSPSCQEAVSPSQVVLQQMPDTFCTSVMTPNRIAQQHDIMSMEDDDVASDTEQHGCSENIDPFVSLKQLQQNPAHLASFIKYLISNNDPSSLFFYLISDLYIRGNAKEMKKWAYEIHSSFLVPGAPLKVNNVDENILHEIDYVLQNDLDKEEILRRVFWKARKKAHEELKDFLQDFCAKRTLGLGSLFGHPDMKLEESLNDRVKELKIVENLLLPLLGEYLPDIENNIKTCATASSLATLLTKSFGIKTPHSLQVIERCPTFVAKEKSRLKFLNRNKKAQMIQGHHFMPQHYFNVTYCNHCQLIIGGVGNQGYQCQICEMNIHKACGKVVEETCIGAMRSKKEKKKDRKSGIMENFMGKMKPIPPSSNNRRFHDEVDSGNTTFYGEGDDPDRPNPASRVEKLKNRYETLSEGDERNSSMSPHSLNSSNEHMPQSGSPANEPSTNGDSGKRGPSIARSESLRTRREHQRHSFRKRSDPNIPQSKSDAEDTTGSSLHPSASSSSCSSSTRSLDSPSNSLEVVSKQGSTDGGNSVPLHIQLGNDSDLDPDLEADPPNWKDTVDRDIVRNLKPKERKRQEVINELFHTERTHVRNLKILDTVFCRPMQQEQILPNDQLSLLFANIDEMLEIHGHFNSMMKTRKKENVIVGDIGNLMLDMFDGQAGERFRQAAAEFCKHQSIALEALKTAKKKDQKLAQFLADAEGKPVCRRFQLKDFIPTGMQRLTKYPLLLENLAKYSPPNSEEYSNLIRAVECCKDNLNFVNQMVKETENHHRLVELQKRLDRAPFEKVDHPLTHEFRNLDLTKYQMIHEGPLTWRVSRQKVIDLHVLLLENMLVLLQKQDDKYVLKFHKEESRHSPIIKLNNFLTRNVAIDKKAFFIVLTSSASNVGPQIYEMVAISSGDRDTWLRHITVTAEAYKTREGKTKLDVPSIVNDKPEPTSSEVLEDHEKEKTPVELQESQELPEIEDNGEQNDSIEIDIEASSPFVKSSEGDDQDPSSAYMEDIATGGACASPSGSLSVMSSPSGRISPALQSPSPSPNALVIEKTEILEAPQLIEPSEVVVLETAIVHTAQPVLTPLEKIRRKERIIQRELAEKQNLIAEVLRIPKEEYEHIADIAGQPEGNKDAKDLVLAAINQATRLTEVINESLTLSEDDVIGASASVLPQVQPMNNLEHLASSESPDASVHKQASRSLTRTNKRLPAAPVHKLMDISKSLQDYLVHLLRVIADKDEEMNRMKTELRASREQIHLLHESQLHVPTFQSPADSMQHSRPNSFISISSSAPSDTGDGSEFHPLEEADDEFPVNVEDDLKTPTHEDNEIILAESFAAADLAQNLIANEQAKPTERMPSVDESSEDRLNIVENGDEETSTDKGNENAENHVHGAIF